MFNRFYVYIKEFYKISFYPLFKLKELYMATLFLQKWRYIFKDRNCDVLR